LPSFFGGGGQSERVNGFFIVAHPADALQPRQHFRGALRQWRQGFRVPFHVANISDGSGQFTFCFQSQLPARRVDVAAFFAAQCARQFFVSPKLAGICEKCSIGVRQAEVYGATSQF